jgi:hypothetical protein
MFKPNYIENYFQDSASYGYFSSGKDIYPSSYLDYAKKDIGDGDDRRNRVNAVGNAKRAFHFQAEMLCEAFGWKIIYKDKLVSFPTKLEFLGKCGVLSPNILRKLNKMRNDIEHDYIVPGKEEVDDYIDIVELFLMATKDLLDRFPEDIEWELMKDEEYDESLGLPGFIRTNITLSEGRLKIIAGEEEIEKLISDDDYFGWLSSIVKQYVL